MFPVVSEFSWHVWDGMLFCWDISDLGQRMVPHDTFFNLDAFEIQFQAIFTSEPSLFLFQVTLIP